MIVLTYANENIAMLPPIQSSISESKREISGVPLTDPVAMLMADVGEACDGHPAAMGDRIRDALRRAATNPAFLPARFRAPRAGCYARHTIASDPGGRFTLLSIVWSPDQFSPPHAHDTWCAYAVAENALTETLFDFDAEIARAVSAGTSVRKPDYACFAPAGLGQIHRLGNAGAIPAISIHVYGVDRSRVGTHVNRLMDVAETRGGSVG
jgi:predicted metal-dependent enzyme (double-stranded beta helix superfamily)